MAEIKFANNASGKLETALAHNSFQALLERSDESARFPTFLYSPAAPYFYCTVGDTTKNTFEIIKVTHVYVDDDPLTTPLRWNITRAQEGTVAKAWPVGTPVELRLTNQGILDIQEQTKEKAVEEIANATPRVTLSNDVTAGPVEYNPLTGFSLPVTVNRASQLTTGRFLQTQLDRFSLESFDGTRDITIGVTGTLPIIHGGTGNTSGLAASATKLAATRTLLVNLASTTAANFDGSANVTLGITGILPIGNGGTGNNTGTVNNATKLATSRTIQTNLASTTASPFDGTANVTPGVTGTLPVTNGGTGATTPAVALTNLGITYGTADLTAGTSALTTGAIYLVYE